MTKKKTLKDLFKPKKGCGCGVTIVEEKKEEKKK